MLRIAKRVRSSIVNGDSIYSVVRLLDLAIVAQTGKAPRRGLRVALRLRHCAVYTYEIFAAFPNAIQVDCKAEIGLGIRCDFYSKRKKVLSREKRDSLNCTDPLFKLHDWPGTLPRSGDPCWLTHHISSHIELKTMRYLRPTRVRLFCRSQELGRLCDLTVVIPRTRCIQSKRLNNN